MSSPSQASSLVLLFLTLLFVPATHALPLNLDSPSALTITNVTLPFIPTATTSLNQSPSSSLAPTIIHYIPHTYPMLILLIEPLPHATPIDKDMIPVAMRAAISYQQYLMARDHLSRSALCPGRFSCGRSLAFTLQACDMGALHAPNPWQVGNLLDVMEGVAQVADQIEWEGGITVLRSVGGGATEEVAAGALYRDRPRDAGGVVVSSRDVGEGTCTAGPVAGEASVNTNAPQLTG